jgi:NAD(P)-dependent dehydrogenase (short-subunit alcohol dehydrogenase family)
MANAADRSAWIGPTVVDTTPEQFDQAMAAVPRASFLLAKHAVPEMARGGGGSIIFTSSIRGLNGSSSFLMYNLSKSTLQVLAKCIAIDYGPAGIRCNCIAPGVVQSQLEDGEPGPDSPRTRYLAECYPLRRVGRTKDIADAAVFLASDEASWITGQTLVVDGGITSQSQDDLANRMSGFLKQHPEMLAGL